MAGTYRNYMKLLKSWPLDKSKADRDLGEHIRDQLKIAFAKGDLGSQLDQELCNRYYMSLKRLCSNHYGQTYTRVYSNTASGLTREQCNLALTPEMRKILEEGEPGIIKRTIARVMNYYYPTKV